LFLARIDASSSQIDEVATDDWQLAIDD
jgi:hypothetical protein